MRAGLRWDGPKQYQRAWLVKPICSDSWCHCWDVLVLRWRTTRAVLFSAKLRFRPIEQLGAWGLRLGLVRRARNCSALPYSQPAWIRCIKDICGHSKRPPPPNPQTPCYEQRAPWDWLLQLVSVTGSSPSLRKQKKVESFRGGTLIANPKCSFDFFFSRIYTFMMYKNGQTVTLCSIALSESPQFKLSNCKVHHIVYMLTYTQNPKDLHKNHETA